MTDRIGAEVQVVAHRGASAELPEHTLAAYIRAVEDGADALECDVRLTADGHLVCIHDRRVDRTSDGAGRVSALRLDQLAALDFGSWKAGPWAAGPRALEAPASETSALETPASETAAPGDGAVRGGRHGTEHDTRSLLTLRRLFELVADHGHLGLAVETKHPSRHGAGVERALAELLAEFGWLGPRADAPSPVRVMSFSRAALRRMRSLAPQMETVLLLPRVPAVLHEGTLPESVTIVGPAIGYVRRRPEAVQRMVRSGRRVHVWTVDDAADVDLCVAVGAEAIITNRPRATAGHLRGR